MVKFCEILKGIFMVEKEQKNMIPEGKITGDQRVQQKVHADPFSEFRQQARELKDLHKAVFAKREERDCLLRSEVSLKKFPEVTVEDVKGRDTERYFVPLNSINVPISRIVETKTGVEIFYDGSGKELSEDAVGDYKTFSSKMALYDYLTEQPEAMKRLFPDISDDFLSRLNEKQKSLNAATQEFKANKSELVKDIEDGIDVNKIRTVSLKSTLHDAARAEGEVFIVSSQSEDLAAVESIYSSKLTDAEFQDSNGNAVAVPDDTAFFYTHQKTELLLYLAEHPKVARVYGRKRCQKRCQEPFLSK